MPGEGSGPTRLQMGKSGNVLGHLAGDVSHLGQSVGNNAWLSYRAISAGSVAPRGLRLIGRWSARARAAVRTAPGHCRGPKSPGRVIHFHIPMPSVLKIPVFVVNFTYTDKSCQIERAPTPSTGNYGN